jgi:D-serine deaminase-like pyridoxal phosphate-dependent protein
VSAAANTVIPHALPAPARPGMRIEEVDTPALLLDLDAFERNLRRLHTTLLGRTVRVRPHAKSHKCPQIALRQIALGAVGVCCQKVSEARALVQGGVRDVLIANEVVGAAKLQRLAELGREAQVGVCVDDAANVRELAAAVKAVGSNLDVYVELDVGARRCGAQHLRTPAERTAAIGKAVELVQATVGLLRKAGLDPEIVTGAGTGTYLLEAGSGVYNEIQPGSYVFMDADYGRNLGDDGLPVHEFEQSLFILATVMSRPIRERAVVDVGLKAHSVDSGMPTVSGVEGARYARASDEHGVIELAGPADLRLGQKVRLVPGHCDPTVNLYDWLVCYRGERVEELWPVSARGAFY